MGKFLLGVLTGVILIVLIGVIGIFAVASLGSRPAVVSDNSTLVLRLAGGVPEKSPVEFPNPFADDQTTVTVQQVWGMLRHAATDNRIKAVVFEPEGAGVGWAKMQEIRSDIEQFRKSGKPIYAFLKTPGAREYYMASACSRIYMEPVDMLNLKGIGFELMYFRNTLDKLGVQVEIEHAGKYKDFGDTFTKTSMSPETREVMNSLADNLYGDLINTIAKGRKQDPATIRATIDEGPFLSTQAKDKGLVDALRYEDEVFGELKTALKQSEIKKVTAKVYSEAGDGVTGSSDRIAYVVGEGSISRGSPESSGDDGLQSAPFVKMLTRVANDKDIKGVIVRIDSPGGEVTASDEMWRAMNELRKKKPVVISMSDAAASGGYYMAMSGDPVLAYPGTVTGSIGVVFGKPNLHGLYDKVGVTKDSVSRGRYALIDSDYKPLTDAERRKLREGIDFDYKEFVSRVAKARKKSYAEIDEVAQGRVWLGDQAKANGLVDELGGIDRAIELVKKKAGIPATGKVTLALYPGKRNWFDMFFRGTQQTQTEAQFEGILSRTGLEPLRAAWKDDRLRVWMRGGRISMMPFQLDFK